MGSAVHLVALGVAMMTTPVAAATVQLTVGGVAAGGGAVFASLCAGGLDAATCTHGQRQSASASSATFYFTDLVPGRYAAIAFQDIDGTGELRRSRMGRPLQPYGLSNGAGRTRRPTFDRAAVVVGTDGARIAIRLEDPGSP